ncbi:TolB-like protein [Shimia isoporae]|uniref:TolB-like protein n=1 Tax=Shimia isoporae TaxID=647720 RepID=A0A4R1NAA0_9RHOB|nr:hypothetical protein [Shimia isoporae]TCL00306.1 TolB-like protein [Shimia isoporae]
MTDKPTKEEIVQQLDRLLGSPDFAAGPRLQKFLTHIVTEELEGRGELLKGTALAMDVFGRGADFDPNNDSIVRIEAIKLRKAVEHYYLTAGAEDEVVITVPKGRYRPAFQRRTIEPSKSVPVARRGLPTLVICQFEGATTEKASVYRDGLPEEIGLELARFGQIRVISGWHESLAGKSPGMADLPAQADYLLRGNVREAGGKLRVSVQLERIPGNSLVWSDRFRVSGDEEDPFDVQEKIAKHCATRMVDAYGAVSEDLNAQYSGRMAEDAGVFEALLSFHAHMRTSRQSSLAEFASLTDAALQDNPSSGLAHALKSISLIEQAAVGGAAVSDIVEAGRQHAEQAVALAPNCQEALFALASFARFQGDTARYETLLARAVAANPNAALMSGMVGGWLAAMGNTREAAAMIDEARARNPLLPIWMNVPRALDPFMNGDFAEASAMVRDVDGRDNLYDWMLIAAIHGKSGELGLGEAALGVFRDANIDVFDYLSSIPLGETVSARITEGLRALSSG